MKYIDKQTFVNSLKTNNISKIVDGMNGIVMENDTKLSHSQKVYLIIDNLCSLKVETIAFLLPTYQISYRDGKTIALFLKSLDCSIEVFGFLNAYYSVDEKMKYNAYINAIKKNRLDILKKIRKTSSKLLHNIRENHLYKYSPSIELENFVKKDYRISVSKQSISPATILKNKLKKNLYK